jgi:hypothetical protein
VTGDAGMAEILESLKALGKLTTDAAPAVSDALEGAIRRQITAGKDPDGKTWRPTKEGEQPLKTAAKALVVVPVGSVVFARLVGHIARHNNATARGGVERQVLPSGGVPPTYARAIRAALDKAFAEAKRG